MKARLIVVLFLCLFLLLSQGEAEAVTGIPDVTQAATLVVPLMERSISGALNTLTVVDSLCLGAQTIHWEIWDIDGNRVGLNGNVSVNGVWVSDFGSIIGTATPAQVTQLTDGSFYRGFMTVDMVSASTTLSPLEGAYPFSNNNCLTGRTYYVRLLEGAANGIPMVHIEGGISGSTSAYLRGFYQDADDREEIDNRSRYYTYLTSNEQAGTLDPNDKLDHIISRVYLSPPNGTSRIVIWAWVPANNPTTAVGGPFDYWHFNESGVQVSDTTVNLNHIVNVIDVSGTANGQVWINDLTGGFQVYAFSINSSLLISDPSLTWEAMFESTILPDWLP